MIKKRPGDRLKSRIAFISITKAKGDMLLKTDANTSTKFYEYIFNRDLSLLNCIISEGECFQRP